MFFKRKSFEGELAVDLKKLAIAAQRITDFLEHMPAYPPKRSDKETIPVAFEVLDGSLYLTTGNKYYHGLVMIQADVAEKDAKTVFSFNRAHLIQLSRIGDEYSGNTTLVFRDGTVMVGSITMHQEGAAHSVKSLVRQSYPAVFSFERKTVLEGLQQFNPEKYVTIAYNHHNVALTFSQKKAGEPLKVSVQSSYAANKSVECRLNGLQAGVELLQNETISLQLTLLPTGIIKLAEANDHQQGSLEYYFSPVSQQNYGSSARDSYNFQHALYELFMNGFSNKK